MAGVQGSALAIAVCNAGGLGAVPCAMLDAEGIQRELAAVRAATTKPFAVNFFCHVPPRPDPVVERRWRALLAPYYVELGLDPEQVVAAPARVPFGAEAADAIEPFEPPVVSFHFGLPAPDLLARVKRWGAKVLATATTVDEARWLAARGVDGIVAQGLEAGGHRGHFLAGDGSRSPIACARPRARDSRGGRDLPVIAAGGIADANGVAEAIEAGADAAMVGTAYLLSPEATTSAVHRAAIAEGRRGRTAITNVFSGRPARGIVNRLMRELGPMSEATPAFPLAAAAVAPLRAAAERRGSGDFSPLWAGESESLLRACPRRSSRASWRPRSDAEQCSAEVRRARTPPRDIAFAACLKSWDRPAAKAISRGGVRARSASALHCCTSDFGRQLARDLGGGHARATPRSPLPRAGRNPRGPGSRPLRATADGRGRERERGRGSRSGPSSRISRLTMPRAGRPVKTLVSAVWRAASLDVARWTASRRGFGAEQVGRADLHGCGSARRRRDARVAMPPAAIIGTSTARRSRHQVERANAAWPLAARNIPGGRPPRCPAR